MTEWNKYLNEGRFKISGREPLPSDYRNEFESDLGRVIFSPAVRRMHDKTQVFPLTTDDNIHSRLTHSMEVMSLGYSIALDLCNNEKFISETGLDKNEALRKIPIIVANACLVHDIGNPPFGHFGEKVIQNYFQEFFECDPETYEIKNTHELPDSEIRDFIFFDGNAQGFRVLTKLQVLDDAYGLNLTYATLGAYLKYPHIGNPNKGKLNQKKQGVFHSEESRLTKIAQQCGLTNPSSNIMRHPLSYIVEAADSICYLIMDIEDGYNKKWFNYEDIKNQLKEIDGMEKIFADIEGKKPKNEVTKVVKLRIALMQRLVGLTIKNYTEHLKEICAGDYNHELIKDDKSELEKGLSDFCSQYILSHREITSLELTGHSVLKGLLDYYINFCFNKPVEYQKRASGMISNSIRRASLIETGTTEFVNLTAYYKLKVIVDFISGMTDQYALTHFQKISGQKIN